MSVSSRQAWSTEGSRTARDRTLRPSSKKNGRDVVPQGGPRLPFLYLPLSDPPTCEPSLRAELRPSTTFLHQDSCPDTPSFQSTPSTNELTSEMEVGRFLIPYACFSHSYMQISQFASNRSRIYSSSATVLFGFSHCRGFLWPHCPHALSCPQSCNQSKTHSNKPHVTSPYATPPNLPGVLEETPRCLPLASNGL